jgi:hypothetical protein
MTGGARNGVPDTFGDLWVADRDQQNEAYRSLLEDTEGGADWAGEVWDDVVGHLDDDNHNRSIAAQIMVNLGVGLPDRLVDDFGALTAVTYDDRFVTARHALQSLWRVGTIGPRHRDLLIDFLRQRFDDASKDKNTTLIRADIIELLARLHAAEHDEVVGDVADELIAAEDDDKYRAKYATIWRRTSGGD